MPAARRRRPCCCHRSPPVSVSRRWHSPSRMDAGIWAASRWRQRGAAPPFALTMAQAAACLANEMVGGAEKLRESALEYAKLRYQFGRPIASFQSMKHKQADMLLDFELAKAAAYAAASAAADNDP